MPDPAAGTAARVQWRNNAMGGLLALMAFGIFVVPALSSGHDDLSLGGKAMLMLILGVGIGAISEFRRLAALLAVLAVALVLAWVLERSIRWHGPLLIAALSVLAVAIGVNVFAARRPVLDRLLGAVALYLLIAMIFASVYAVIAATVPGAFAGALPAHATMFDWGYLSLVTLTTVGYGDITPVVNVARASCALEALIGQLYPAIIIARLVSAPDS